MTDCDIGEVQLNGFNSQLNITDTLTKIADILTSTKSMIILEAGKYDGMKDPVVTDNGELTRIDMTEDKTLSILSIYSNPKKAEYKLNEEIDLTGLIVMGTYTASVEIFKSGGWKGKAIESVTKWEDEEDYDVDCDFSKTGVRIVTIKSTINPGVACNFYVYVVDDSQNGETSKPEKIEFTNIRVESLLLMPKTSYKVGEKLDLSGYRVMGTYNGLNVNLQYTSDPANGTVLEKDVVVKFYYANQEIDEGIFIKVTQPYTVKFYDGIDSSKPLYTTEAVDGELLKLPSAPNRENYIFDGWYIGDEKVTSEYIVKSNLELIAQWKVKYTVKFNANGGIGTMDSQTFTYDVAKELTANEFTRPGYTFAGWAESTRGEVVYADKASVKNLVKENNVTVTLYAKWTANTDTAYKVEHYQQNITDDEYTLAETENKTGTTFALTNVQPKTYEGFFKKEKNDVFIQADGSSVVTIYYDRNKITLTLDLDGGKGQTEITGKYGATVTTPTAPTKSGYEFACWNPQLPTTFPAKSATYTATWAKEGDYVITYKLNGGTNASDNLASYNVETATITLADATKAGYTFGGWYTDEACTIAKTEIKTGSTGNLTLYAKWIANTDTAYKVEHYQQNANDDDYTLVTADTENKTGTTDEDTSAQAKTYEGFTAKTVEQVKIAADGSTVVKINYDRNTITLTLNLDGGEGETEITGKYGAVVTTPANPTKTGYTFAGWNSDLPATFPATNETYKATWDEAEANAYYVSSIGNDDYNSGTSLSPFKTVQKAVTAINEKTDTSTEFTIYLLDEEFTLSEQIEISKKIRITTYNSENTIAKIKRDSNFKSGNLIEVSSGGELTLANVTIDGNQVENDYSGIYVEGTLNLNDKATIQNCYGQNGCGVFIDGGGKLTMDSGATISNCTASEGGYLTGSGGGVLIWKGELTMNSGATISNCTASEGGGVYLLEGTFTMSGGTIGGAKQTIDGIEKTFECTAKQGGGVYVAGGTFTMSGGSIENCTSNVEKSGGGGVYLAGGTFTMSGNAKISKCNANNTLSKEFCCGGGVYVADGEFKMSDTASIDDCNALSTSASRYGGGVYLAGGTFTMSGGSIKNCDVEGFNNYGGGVYVADGTFKMTGGTISNCTAEQGGGVGVYNFIVKTGSGENTQTTYHNGKFTMSGGTISSCTAQSGGGVYVDGQDSEKARGTFTMTGGEISGNTASSASYPNGGGVLVKGIFEMSDGSITGNMLKRTGGSGACGGAGVAVSTINQNVTGSGGKFTMTGGTISGNKLDESSNDVVGSGVYVMKNATFTNDGGTISDEDIHRAQ